MNRKLSFAVENITPVEDENLDKSQFSLLRVDAFATGKSWHDTYTTEENLRKNAPTILQKPFVFFTDERFDDAGGHDDREIAAGFVPHNSRLDFKALGDGRVMLCCDVLVWKRYSGDLLRFFNRDGGKKGVSVEIEVSESREDRENGLVELITYCFNAITCLGDMIKPAIPNAEAVLAFSKQYEEAKHEFETQFFDRYGDVDFTIPSKIKKNAEKALTSYKEKGSGATSVSLAVARFLVKNEKITPDKIRQIGKYFKKRNLNPDDISFNLFGGKDAAKWSKTLCESLDQIDSQRASYFSLYGSYNNDQETMSSFDEDGNSNREEEIEMKKKKDEATVTEEEKLSMAAEPEEKEEEPENKEEMAAPPAEPEKEGEKQEEKMADEEDKEEKTDDEKKEGDEFSFGFDVSVAMSMMPDENEACKMAKEEFAKGKDADFSKIAMGMYAALSYCHGKMSEMSSSNETYLSENASLKEFKANVEKEQQKFEVDLTLKDLSEKFEISQEAYEKMQTEGYALEFSNLEEWKKSVRSNAVVAFSVIAKKDTDGITRIALANPFTAHKPKDGDLWLGSNS